MGLPSPAVPPGIKYRWPKLLEYRFPCALGDAPEGPPDKSTEDGRPEPRLDGTNGGDGRADVLTGEVGKLCAVPTGDGGTRDVVGDCTGRLGSDGPAGFESGDWVRNDGDGE